MSWTATGTWTFAVAIGASVLATSPHLSAQVVGCGPRVLEVVPIITSESCIDVGLMRDLNRVEHQVTLTNNFINNVDVEFETIGQSDVIVIDNATGAEGNQFRNLNVTIRNNANVNVTVAVVSLNAGVIDTTLEVSWVNPNTLRREFEVLLDITATVVTCPAPTAPSISIDFAPDFDGNALVDTTAHVSWGASSDPDCGATAGQDRDGVVEYLVDWAYYLVDDCDNVPLGDFNDPFWDLPWTQGFEPVLHDGSPTRSLRTLSAGTDGGGVDLDRHALLVTVAAVDGDGKTTVSTTARCVEVSLPELPARGDANEDGSINLADSVAILNHLFNGGPLLGCPGAGDANTDGGLNIGDPIFLLNFLFDGGPAPTPPDITSCDL